MTIQQILTEGQGLVLNNVKVEDDYGVKTGKTAHRAMVRKKGSSLRAKQPHLPFRPLRPLHGHPRAIHGNSSPQMSLLMLKQLILLGCASVSRALVKK